MSKSVMNKTATFWKDFVIYQIYPRSFKDSNGDGVGDLQGIIEKLDYVKSLGIDTIWISPIYKSPMKDFGYDVADYCDIDPLFGNLDDFKQLVDSAHSKGIKVLMDFVPSHTSDQHPWFIESKSSTNNPKRDWYIWKETKPDGSPPNNWVSVFGGSMWEFNADSGQYYLHSFVKEQPDLNWRNPEVKEAMFNVLRFWMDHGVDGFRIDAINHIFKDVKFLDEPKNEKFNAQTEDPYLSLNHIYVKDQKEIHELIGEMAQVLTEYEDRFMVTEAYVPIAELVNYYKHAYTNHAPYNFHFIFLPWSAKEFGNFINEYDSALSLANKNYIPTYVLGNHDRSRVATRTGKGLRIAAMLLLTLRGIPTIYYGDEIGMTDVKIPPDMVQDPFEINVPGKGLGRDPERTPMQWDASLNSGFTTGTPWLPLSPLYKGINVEKESEEKSSILNYYKKLIKIRKERAELIDGDYKGVVLTSEHILAYTRSKGDKTLLVILNFADSKQSANVSEKTGKVLLSTGDTQEGLAIDLQNLELMPNEGLTIDISTD